MCHLYKIVYGFVGKLHCLIEMGTCSSRWMVIKKVAHVMFENFGRRETGQYFNRLESLEWLYTTTDDFQPIFSLALIC